MPLRARNELLVAAGFAPVYGHTDLGAPELAAVRQALDLVLGHHEPFPALVVDRHWNLVRANAGLALHDELAGYPGARLVAGAQPAGPVLPVRLATPLGELSFFTTAARFGTAADVTLAELTIESFFPADPETDQRVRRAGASAAPAD